MIIIITLYDYELLLLFLHQKEKQWVLHDNYDILRKFISRLLFIIPFIPETLWMLTFSWGNEQLVQSTMQGQKFTKKEILILQYYCTLWRQQESFQIFLNWWSNELALDYSRKEKMIRYTVSSGYLPYNEVKNNLSYIVGVNNLKIY